MFFLGISFLYIIIDFKVLCVYIGALSVKDDYISFFFYLFRLHRIILQCITKSHFHITHQTNDFKSGE